MDLAQLRRAVYTRLGTTSSDAAYPAQAVNGALNEGNHFLESEEQWPWLDAEETITTVGGTDTYTPALDWLQTHRSGLVIAGYLPLTLYERDDLDRNWTAEETGQPAAYAVFRDRIVLRPTPGGAYSITHRYIRMEPDLTGDTDQPLAPRKYHAAIAEYATYLLLRGNRDDSRAVAAFNAYSAWVRRMAEETRRSSGPMTVSLR
jgi:hypothetical protein